MRIAIKRVLYLALIVGLWQVSIPVFAATTTGQAKMTELQKQIEAKQKEAAEKAKKAKEEEKVQAQLNAAIKKLENDIVATEGRIGQTQQKIEGAQQAIVDKQNSIVGKESQIAKKKEEVFETAVEYHIELDQGNELYAILGSDRISTAIDRSTALNGLTDKLIIDADTLGKERQDLLAAKTQLEQEEQNLKNQKSQLAAYQGALDNQKGQKSEMVDTSKENQQKFVAESKEAIKASEQLKKQFAAIANEEAAKRRASSSGRSSATAIHDGNPSKYGMIWPISGTITTYFGGSTPFQNFHTGLDIAGSAGDPIYAAASGTVAISTVMCCDASASTVDKSYGYGRWIEIKHDNGLATRYGHLMQSTVSSGDRVERGQIIAYRGGSRGMAGAGWSTGAHTHFEVWDAKGPFNPLDVLP
jgi:murein DD-endopeptidase MepM/ murein hydrolase activator NlpD